MKEQQRLLQEIALMLEHQDMLSKLTESQCLDEYGYSETHCIDNIGRLELPNVTKIAEQMQMTRGAISKMTKKLLAKGLIEKYTLETNKKEVYFKLTERAGFFLRNMKNVISSGRSVTCSFCPVIPKRRQTRF